jgi:uncharacterized protein YqgV (UPF0045/DUF77 family)
LRELLLGQLDRESNRLNSCGDLLLTIKVNEYNLHDYLTYLDLVIEFDSVMDTLSEMHRAVLECGFNREMLTACVKFLNEVSFLVAAFITKVTEFESSMMWNK